jgi:hypothetical protein
MNGREVVVKEVSPYFSGIFRPWCPKYQRTEAELSGTNTTYVLYVRKEYCGQDLHSLPFSISGERGRAIVSLSSVADRRRPATCDPVRDPGLL